MEFLYPAKIMIRGKTIMQMTKADQQYADDKGAKQRPKKNEKHAKFDQVRDLDNPTALDGYGQGQQIVPTRLVP